LAAGWRERKLEFLRLLASKPMSPSELARRMGVRVDLVYSLASKYRRQGLVESLRIGGATVYRLTERGRRRLEYLASRQVP